MKKRGKPGHKRKFQTKLVCASLLCTLIAVLVTGVGMYIVSIRSVDQVAYDMSTKLVRQVSMNLDDNLSQMEALIYSIEIDPKTIEIFEKYEMDSQPVSLDDEYIVRDKLRQGEYSRRDIHGVYVFGKNGFVYYNSTSPSLKREYCIEQEKWFTQMEDSNSLYILGSHVPNRYLLDKTPVVTLVKNIRNLKTGQRMATILVDVNLELFRRLYQNMDLTEEQYLLIMDADNQLIYSNIGTDISGTVYEGFYQRLFDSEAFQEEDRRYFVENISDKNIYVNYHKSEKTGWKVVSGIDIKTLTNISGNIRMFTILLMVMTGTVTAVLIIMITYHLFRKLDQLKNGMRQVKAGDYKVQIPVSSEDEIGDLCENFNSMNRQLNYLINTVNRLEQEKKEGMIKAAKAELDALQAQINPHFIYNTLESISMMAELNDDEETQKMANALGKLIRISINRGIPLVTVAEEVEHVKSYLLIQKIRFDDLFEVVIHMDNRILDYKIPKLILQPLVENSIYHGLELKGSKGLIEISGWSEGKDLRFCIHDNGIGMNPETLKMVRERIQSNDLEEGSSPRSIGLINVHQRIKLYAHDNQYGLSIDSVLNEGTRITVRLPVKECGEVSVS